MRWIKPRRRFQSDNPKAKRDAPSEKRAKAVLVTVQETKARAQVSVQEPMMGAIVHEPPENEVWELVNRRNAARPVVLPTEDRSTRVSFQVEGSSSNKRSLPSLADQNVIPEQGVIEEIQKELGSSYMEVAIPVQQKNEQEWQMAGRKKKGKKPIIGHAALAEEIIDIRRSVGIISDIPREEEIQSLISYLRGEGERGERAKKKEGRNPFKEGRERSALTPRELLARGLR
ncbi:hypothetical protein QQ045_014651 [Rhodiola kirilowii]